MEKFAAEKYGHIFSNLGGMSLQFAQHGPLNELDRETLVFKLGGLVGNCRDIGLSVSALQVEAAVKQLQSNDEWVCAQISQMLVDLGTAMVSEMQTHLFLWVPCEQAKYYQQDALFGEPVNAAFPGAVRDIRSAGNSFATDNWIACVFHSMRVLEFGLNVLAIDFNVPYDQTNWHNIIEAIESKIAGFKNLPRGDAKAQKEKLSSVAAVQFRYFKNAWRNHTMHVREIYDDHDAKSIMDHTGDFMRHLVDDLKLKE